MNEDYQRTIAQLAFLQKRIVRMANLLAEASEVLEHCVGEFGDKRAEKRRVTMLTRLDAFFNESGVPQ